MISSAFETFDPFTYEKPGFPWAALIIGWRTLLFLIHGKRSNLILVFKVCIYWVKVHFLRFDGRTLRGLKVLLASVLLTLLFVNSWGLLPAGFRVTRHLLWTFCMGFPIWLFFVVKRARENYFLFGGNLLPAFCRVGSSPRYGLIIALTFLEGVRLIIQPLTLSIRMMANIGAGHLVLGLARNVIVLARIFLTKWLALLFLIGYLLFEVAVNLLQAYIFFLLLLRYRSLNVGITAK